jgi:hypothetical protein
MRSLSNQDVTDENHRSRWVEDSTGSYSTKSCTYPSRSKRPILQGPATSRPVAIPLMAALRPFGFLVPARHSGSCWSCVFCSQEWASLVVFLPIFMALLLAAFVRYGFVPSCFPPRTDRGGSTDPLSFLSFDHLNCLAISVLAGDWLPDDGCQIMYFYGSTTSCSLASALESFVCPFRDCGRSTLRLTSRAGWILLAGFSLIKTHRFV